MSIIKNLILIYGILPYISVIQNRLELIFSILIGCSNFKIKIQNTVVNFTSSQYNTLLYLLGIITYSFSYSVKSDGILELSLDTKNKFSFSLTKLSYEDQNLLDLLFLGSRYGANFITTNNYDKNKHRDKQIKIYESENKKIVETSNGIKFYLDSIHPGNSIVETFINKIHLINFTDNWENKIVLDVGAECGDTALFYADMGAIVYSFEPIKNNFDAMIRNLSLNPELSKRIIPINAAIGEDKTLKFFKDPNSPDMGASFVYNVRGNNAKIEYAKGYSLKQALKEFKIEQVDLLKMDCKGCEFFLTEESLKKIKKIKIEYAAGYSKHKVEDLLNLLEKSGFDFIIYRNPFSSRLSNKDFGFIYGEKIDASVPN